MLWCCSWVSDNKEIYKMTSLAVLTLFVVIGFSSAVQNEGSVKLTVFYESYCSDSVRFVANQLYGTWKDLKQFIRLELVPFGFAEQWYEDGHFKFRCQHGPKECVGNILHACALYEACGSRKSLDCPADDLTKAVDYINCVMQERNQLDASDQCASDAGLLPQAIADCAGSGLGERLESGYGNDTTAFTKSNIDYIPFIVINDTYTKEQQQEAEDDLKALICKYIPDQCNSTTLTANKILVK